MESKKERERAVILHVVESLVGLPSLHTRDLVGVVVGRTGPGVGLVDRVLRGSFVGHPIIPEEDHNME